MANYSLLIGTLKGEVKFAQKGPPANINKSFKTFENDGSVDLIEVVNKSQGLVKHKRLKPQVESTDPAEAIAEPKRKRPPKKD